MKKTKKMLEIEERLGEPLKDYFSREYEKKLRSQSSIAQELGYKSVNSVRQWLIKFGIEIRELITYENLDDCVKRVNKIKEQYNFDTLPPHDKLNELGFGGLSKAITGRHGGYKKFRRLLGEKKIRRSLAEMSNKEFIKFVNNNFNGLTISDLHKKDGTIYEGIRKRGLFDKLYSEGIILRAYRKKGYLSSMSNEEIVEFVKNKHKGKSISDLASENSTLIDEIRNRNLLESLIEHGIIIRKGNPYFFVEMSDDELLDHSRKECAGMTLTQATYEKWGLMKQLRKRDMLSILLEEGIIKRMRRENNPFVGMTNEELISYINKNFFGSSLYELSEKDRTVYREINKRCLKECLLEEGILVYLNGKSKSSNNHEKFIKQDPVAYDISSLTTITNDIGAVAGILVKLYPHRFCSAAELARSLPGAVKRIGHSLKPFTMEKAARFRERTKGLPQEVRYNLDQILVNIIQEQYQARFNSDPKGTLEDLKRFSKDGSIRPLTLKVLGYYKSIYDFEIPGFGAMGRYNY